MTLKDLGNILDRLGPGDIILLGLAAVWMALWLLNGIFDEWRKFETDHWKRVAAFWRKVLGAIEAVRRRMKAVASLGPWVLRLIVAFALLGCGVLVFVAVVGSLNQLPAVERQLEFFVRQTLQGPRCAENEECPGQPVACSLAGDDNDGSRGRLLLVGFSAATAKSVEAGVTNGIEFGPWSNTECGQSGTGWHAQGGTCSTGRGDGWKRCEFVIMAPTQPVKIDFTTRNSSLPAEEQQVSGCHCGSPSIEFREGPYRARVGEIFRVQYDASTICRGQGFRDLSGDISWGVGPRTPLVLNYRNHEFPGIAGTFERSYPGPGTFKIAAHVLVDCIDSNVPCEISCEASGETTVTVVE